MRRVLPLAAMLIAGGTPALAGPLMISPTTVQFDTGRRSAAIEIVNQSEAPVDLQFRAFAWSQVDGQERLIPTDTLAISPPIVTVAPHAKQVFRVLEMGPGAEAAEQSYRLKLNELPRPGAETIAINLEFSLPVFRTPANAAARINWSADLSGTIRVANHGSRRVRVASLTIDTGTGITVPVPAAQSTYLLSGADRSFAIPAGVRLGPGARLRGMTDAGPIDVQIVALAAN